MSKKNKIPKTFNRGKTYWSKKHVDAYFSSKAPDTDITEWYSVQEVQDKFQMSLTLYTLLFIKMPFRKRRLVLQYIIQKSTSI